MQQDGTLLFKIKGLKRTGLHARAARSRGGAQTCAQRWLWSLAGSLGERLLLPGRIVVACEVGVDGASRAAASLVAPVMASATIPINMPMTSGRGGPSKLRQTNLASVPSGPLSMMTLYCSPLAWVARKLMVPVGLALKGSIRIAGQYFELSATRAGTRDDNCSC